MCFSVGSTQSSIPLPRVKKGERRWQVELGADGLLRGCEGPSSSREASITHAITCISFCNHDFETSFASALVSPYFRAATLQNDKILNVQVEELLQQVLHSGHELSEDEITALFSVRGADFDAVCRAAGGCCVTSSVTFCKLSVLRHSVNMF